MYKYYTSHMYIYYFANQYYFPVLIPWQQILIKINTLSYRKYFNQNALTALILCRKQNYMLNYFKLMRIL